MHQKFIILKSESELKKIFKSTRNSLEKMSEFTFWKKHFENHKFHFNKKAFDWDSFLQIPFSTKDDFSGLAVERRLSDITKFTKKNPFGISLSSTSGTTNGKPALLVNGTYRENEGMGIFLKKKGRKLFLFQPRTLSLRVLCSLIEGAERGKKDNQVIFVNPFGFKTEMIEAISQMNPSEIVTFPATISFLTSTFPKIKKIFSASKRLLLGGDFLSRNQADSFARLYPNLKITHDYLTGELGFVGAGCNLLSKKHGINTYHPLDDGIIELININEEGVGEIVATKLNPPEMGYIRYRTGDLARIIKEVCPCGKSWMFYLIGRDNMDYFKVLGALISRAEIEKALKNLGDIIEDWRGEVREVKINDFFIGELKLILKPYAGGQANVNKLKNLISTRLRLTPKKTLSDLVKEKKFMPLKIEITNNFPEANKKVLLRKILD